MTPTCSRGVRESGLLHVAVEWGAEGAAEYDVAALESPRLSDSTQAARDRERQEPHFTLQQCVEVRAFHLPQTHVDILRFYICWLVPLFFWPPPNASAFRNEPGHLL